MDEHVVRDLHVEAMLAAKPLEVREPLGGVVLGRGIRRVHHVGDAEAENHHPDIAVSYRDVTLRWRTHSADAITDRDRDMAARSAALV